MRRFETWVQCAKEQVEERESLLQPVDGPAKLSPSRFAPPTIDQRERHWNLARSVVHDKVGDGVEQLG